jgi:hypothetical protein
MREKRSGHMIERRRMTQELLSDAFELRDVFLGHDAYPFRPASRLADPPSSRNG